MARTERHRIGDVEVRQYVIPLAGQRRRRSRPDPAGVAQVTTAAAAVDDVDHPVLFEVEDDGHG